MPLSKLSQKWYWPRSRGSRWPIGYTNRRYGKWEGLVITKLISSFLILSACAGLTLVAEDFWLKKPYTKWNEKEAAKVLQSSPWAHEVTVTLGGDESGMKGRSRRSDRGGDISEGGPAGSGTGSPGAMEPVGGMGGGSTMNAPIMTGNGGDMGRGGATARGGGDAGAMTSARSLTVTVRWQSAPTVREALVVARFGPEKADSPEAKDFLNKSLPAYVIAVAGLPAAMGQIPQDRLNAVAQGASLQRKDKHPIAAESAQIAQREKSADVFFLFPKTDAITLDDKEVEFEAKFGRLEIKRKFRLKDMLTGDTLAL